MLSTYGREKGTPNSLVKYGFEHKKLLSAPCTECNRLREIRRVLSLYPLAMRLECEWSAANQPVLRRAICLNSRHTALFEHALSPLPTSKAVGVGHPPLPASMIHSPNHSNKCNPCFLACFFYGINIFAWFRIMNMSLKIKNMPRPAIGKFAFIDVCQSHTVYVLSLAVANCALLKLGNLSIILKFHTISIDNRYQHQCRFAHIFQSP